MQYNGLFQSCRIRADGVIRSLQSTFLNQIRIKSIAVNLAHKIYGCSPTPDSVPIFVLPDCLATKSNWDNMCKKLTSYSKRPVVAVDPRNHGDSPKSDCHDYQSLAADVTQLMTEFEIESSIIIGHGMGGRTGMFLALKEVSFFLL